jgi:hypothetical protein
MQTQATPQAEPPRNPPQFGDEPEATLRCAGLWVYIPEKATAEDIRHTVEALERFSACR